MAGERSATVTLLLQRMEQGDEAASAELLPLLYEELRTIARRLFRGQRPGHTLQPTALVHEAYIKVLGKRADGGKEWHGRAHFLGVAAIAMRQILVNHARDRAALRRGGPEARRVTLTGIADFDDSDTLEVLSVHEALEGLKRLDPRQARIAELRFFGSLTLDETAEVLGISRRTVALDWKMAKRWLAKRLAPETS